MTTVRAALVIVQHEGRLLLLKRQSEDRSCTGWCFPGGKVDTGETLVTAALRELKEETQLTGYPLTCIWEGDVRLRDRVYGITAFQTTADGPQPEVVLSSEHDDFGWFIPGEALALELAGPATRTILGMCGTIAPRKELWK